MAHVPASAIYAAAVHSSRVRGTCLQDVNEQVGRGFLQSAELALLPTGRKKCLGTVANAGRDIPYIGSIIGD